MILWQLWRSLRTPPAEIKLPSPVVEMLARPLYETHHKKQVQAAGCQGAIGIVAMISPVCAIILFPRIGVGAGFFLIFFAFPFAILLVHSLNGILTAQRIGYVVARSHADRRDELLSTTPLGAFGAVWLRAYLAFHHPSRLASFLRILVRGVAYSMFVVFAFIMCLLSIGMFTGGSYSADGLVILFTYVFGLPLAILLDFALVRFQAAGVGLLAGRMVRDPIQAGGLAVAVFIIMQVIVYAVAIAFLINIGATVVGIPITVMLLLLLRFVLIYAVWQGVIRAYEDVAEGLRHVGG